MSSFYKDLKELRKESGIDLEEIHNRTKISLDALRAIESGKFDELPQTYIRLFVRAYANEIGADENSTLSELNKFLAEESKIDSQTESNKTYQDIKKVAEKKDVDQIKPSSTTSKNIRSDTLKGFALLSILIFSIYTIRQINKEEASKAPIVYQSDFEEEGPITNQILQNDFDLFSESIQIMEHQAPFTFKMATAERVWYKTKIDTLTSFEDILPSGDNRLYEFSDSLIVLFKYSKGLNLYLNGSPLNSFKSSSNPLRIIFSSIDKTVTIQQFIPKN